MSRVVIIGAGVMGLAAAFHACKRGHSVTLLEGAPEPGGMAAHLDLAGLSIERFYHFVCKADHATFELLGDLGLADKMRWVPTSMGYFMDGRLYNWGDPLSLLAFPHFTLLQKLRYGAMMFMASKQKHPGKLEDISAKAWIISWCGRTVYERLWAPLFEYKFHEYADNISALWIWTRIKHLGTSRRSLFQEELGYIEGGSQTLVDALVRSIAVRGGKLCLETTADHIECSNSAVTGVFAGSERYPADAVICTIPTPYVSRLISDMEPSQRAAYDKIVNIGVVCLVFRLKRQVTPHFWVNISDGRIGIPGIVEFSNLRPTGDTVVYIPYYIPPSNPLFSRSDEVFFEEAFGYLKFINPTLTETDIVAKHIGRLRHAQPVCPPGFASMLPPVQTAIRGLQIADTCFYYPEDRRISESVRLGRIMAERLEMTMSRTVSRSLA